MSSSRGHGLAVVTGASSGIGAAIARELSRRGRPVLAVARREQRLAELAREARARGGEVHVLAADVTAEGAAERIRDRARELGGAEWVVNDAGVGWFGRFSGMPARRLAEMVRLNCEALVLLTHALLPDLLAARRGTVLNVASLAALTPTPFMSAYGATKAFVASFSESLAIELRGSGVSVTAFCPGPVDTEFGDVSGYSARGRIPRPPGRVGAHASARAAIAAAEARQVVSVPGALNKMAAAAAWFLPRALSRRFADVVLRPASPE